MRIIGGRLKGIRFNPPDNIPTRPTTDIAKEALFNTLNTYFNFDSLRFLDLFGGTGSISYEMASRGCTDITTVEIFPKCAKFIKDTAAQLKLEGIHVIREDVFRFLENAEGSYHIIFAGPPYPLTSLVELPDIIFKRNLLLGAGWFILEHSPAYQFDDHPKLILKRNYGQTIFSIFSNHKLE